MSATTAHVIRDHHAPALHRLIPATGFILAAFPLSWGGFACVLVLLSAGLGLIVLWIGLPVLVSCLLVARGFGTAERELIGRIGLGHIVAPVWQTPEPGATWFARLVWPLRSGHHWAYAVHTLLISPILSTISFTVTLTWWASAVGGLTSWAWFRLLPARTPGNDWPGWVSTQWVPFFGLDSAGVEQGIYLLGGALFAISLPWVVSTLGHAHVAVATSMLGRWNSDEVALALRDESRARQAAVQAEDSTMWRLERDLHDGPQQRLVRLQMDLAAARRRVEAGDMDRAADLTREAQEQAHAALDELRALSRGVAPPLLADRGLVAALVALGADCAVPVATEVDTSLDDDVGSEVARGVYFMAAELLANVAKHSHASHATLTVVVERHEGPRLLLRVDDDGRGGCTLRAGHGLDGLRERAQSLRGELAVESPTGGPTRVQVALPLSYHRETVWSSSPAEGAAPRS